MYILSKLSSLVIAGAMSLGLITAPVQTVSQPISFGAAVPTTPALYDGYLSSNILRTDTTMSVTPGTNRNGQTLSGYMCFVIDVNQPTVEYVCGTAAGTSITNLSRGIDFVDPTSTSSALAFGHRRYASVTVSDYPTIQFLVRKMNGTDSLDTPLSYSFASTSITSPYHLTDKEYVDGLAFNGAAVINASTVAKGSTQIATTLQAASSTATGSTGATLVIPASSATSTYNSATAALRVVVTQNSGKIDTNFLPSTVVTTTGNNTFTGINTFSTTTATSTMIGSFPAYKIGKNIQIFTANGTFTRPSGVNFIKVEVIGGGGGGGNVGSSAAGGGGGAGAYCVKYADISATSSINVIVGASVSGGNNGNTSSFGPSICSATGGTAGSASYDGGSGGTSTGGDINTPGQIGFFGVTDTNSSTVTSYGGYGGSTLYGRGGNGARGGTAALGGDASGYGSGGGGSASGNSGGSNTGGTGAAGIVIVTW